MFYHMHSEVKLQYGCYQRKRNFFKHFMMLSHFAFEWDSRILGGK